MKQASKKTMHDMYGDGSDHVACEKCGFCATCGDCQTYGCGTKTDMTKSLKMSEGSIWRFSKEFAIEQKILKIDPLGYPVLPLRFAIQRDGERLAVDFLGRIWIGEAGKDRPMESPSLTGCLNYAETYFPDEKEQIHLAWNDGNLIVAFAMDNGLGLADTLRELGDSACPSIKYSETSFED